MQYIGDFHIHSKYSRAVSPKMDLEHMNKFAKIKGIDILTTGDFTHPEWFKELKGKLVEVKEGIYHLKKEKNNPQTTNFILTTELSCIYKKNDKVRRIHIVIFSPNLATVDKINKKLGKRFNIHSDGRPILGIDSRDLVKLLLDISKDIFIVPAHIWTPWFSLFGSKSGFDSIEECFGDMTKNIYALETGLSADPPMCWRLSALDKYTLISNSDAHSMRNLGREANVFDLKELNYQSIVNAIKTRKGLLYTIEFFPQEGKYYLDGHRNCQVWMNPSQTKKNNGICPKCKKPLTIGVLHRVDDLADRPEGFRPVGAIGYKSLIPLAEIISQIEGVGKNSKKVQKIYQDMIEKGKNEFNILLNLSKEELAKISWPRLSSAIIEMRKGNVIKESGYDGVYGKIKVLENKKIVKVKQEKLF